MEIGLIFCLRSFSSGRHHVRTHVPPDPTDDGARLLLRLVGVDLASRLPEPVPGDYGPAEGMDDLLAVVAGLVHLLGAVLAKRRTGQTGAHDVQGHAAYPAGAAARLPRVPLRLPLCVLRRDSAELHPDAEPDLVRVPTEHANARSVHAEPEGGHAGGDGQSAEDSHEFRRQHYADPVPTESGLVLKDTRTSHVLVRVARLPADLE